MANVTAMRFDDPAGAENMLENVMTWQEQGLVKVIDAVIAKRGTGSDIEVEQTHKQAGRYALGGSGIGLLAGLLLGGPIGGLIAGAGIGAITGALRDYGIDDKFINEAIQGLGANNSVLFVMTEDGDAEKLIAELRPHKAQLISTTLDADQEKRLRDALDHEE